MKINIRSWISRLLLFLVFTGLMTFFLFPFSDMGDFVASRVAEATANKVFVQFEDLNIGIIPLSLKLKEVYLETEATPGTTIEELSISPTIGALLASKPYGDVKISGLAKGDLTITLKAGNKTDSGAERHRIVLDAQEIDLKGLHDWLRLPVPMEGKLKLDGDIQADLDLTEAPEANFSLNAIDVKIPPSTINTEIGPQPVPNLRFKSVDLKGRLSAGKLNIESLSIGSDRDDLRGKLKGFINIRILKVMDVPKVDIGSYSLDVDLTLTKAFLSNRDVNLLLGPLEKYVKRSPNGAQIKFRATAPNIEVPPSMSEIL